MSASRVRARLRKGRQQQNKAFLSSQQKAEFPKSAQQFIIFGRRRSFIEGYRITFEDFIERFKKKPVAQVEQAQMSYARKIATYALKRMAEVRAKMKRRKENKVRRNQRLRA